MNIITIIKIASQFKFWDIRHIGIRRFTSGRYNPFLPSKYIELTERDTWHEFKRVNWNNPYFLGKYAILQHKEEVRTFNLLHGL